MDVLSTASYPPMRSLPVQQRQYFLGRGDLKLGCRTQALQASPHGIWGIKQLEFNTVLPAPLLQKYEHIQTTPSDGFYVREVEQNHADSCLLCDSIS